MNYSVHTFYFYCVKNSLFTSYNCPPPFCNSLQNAVITTKNKDRGEIKISPLSYKLPLFSFRKSDVPFELSNFLFCCLTDIVLLTAVRATVRLVYP